MSDVLLDPTPVRVTEADMIAHLNTRYTSVRPYAEPPVDRYVRAAHVQSSQTMWAYGRRICDFLALDKWPSSQAIHGHEVKVSRSDWLTELRAPEKADAWRRWCNYWWLVVSAPEIVKPGELPDGWGLMALSKRGTLRARRKPDYAMTPDLPLDVVAGIAYAAQKHAKGQQP